MIIQGLRGREKQNIYSSNARNTQDSALTHNLIKAAIQLCLYSVHCTDSCWDNVSEEKKHSLLNNKQCVKTHSSECKEMYRVYMNNWSWHTTSQRERASESKREWESARVSRRHRERGGERALLLDVNTSTGPFYFLEVIAVNYKNLPRRLRLYYTNTIKNTAICEHTTS